MSCIYYFIIIKLILTKSFSIKPGCGVDNNNNNCASVSMYCTHVHMYKCTNVCTRYNLLNNARLTGIKKTRESPDSSIKKIYGLKNSLKKKRK